jgi:hypothetical protein
MKSNTSELAAHLARLAPSRPAHLIAEDADTFRLLALRAKRNAESECNGCLPEGAYERRNAAFLKRASGRARAYRGLRVSVGGDPRGCCFYLKHPKLPGNTWGGAESGFGVW